MMRDHSARLTLAMAAARDGNHSSGTDRHVHRVGPSLATSHPATHESRRFVARGQRWRRLGCHPGHLGCMPLVTGRNSAVLLPPAVRAVGPFGASEPMQSGEGVTGQTSRGLVLASPRGDAEVPVARLETSGRRHDPERSCRRTHRSQPVPRPSDHRRFEPSEPSCHLERVIRTVPATRPSASRRTVGI
jgi:hypothetical protein